MDQDLIHYYETIERASADMLEAARAGQWEEVVRLEGACMVLISELKHKAQESRLDAESRRTKTRIMQRILLNDAEIRNLAEPWLSDLEKMLAGKLTVH
ncbi:MAG: flagellar protein FliT [Rubrivivax sp.]